jgi:hypothetical protein
LLDEGIDCGAMPVLAFVITDASGASSHSAEDVELEIQRLNALVQTDDDDGQTLSFVLEDLIWLPAPDWLVLDEQEVSSLADDPRVHPRRQEAYLPLIFTDALAAGGGVPKSGVSTLPNGTCGGMQDRPGPIYGVVAVAKARSATTVSHEVGHFLGLCHTHEQRLPSALNATLQAGQAQACDPGCRTDGDGICDTPVDPGADQCVYDQSCATACRGGQRPDARNLMSYYTSCRNHFSAEQIALMQHSLALRRGWYACSVDECRCEPGDDTCPAGMSCRPHRLDGQKAYLCSLDGSHQAGADCQSVADCAQDSICLSEANSGVQRCARVCVASEPGCDCVRADGTLRVCREDVVP